MSRGALVTLALFLSYRGDGTIGISMFGQWHLGLDWAGCQLQIIGRKKSRFKEREEADRRKERKKGTKWDGRVEGKKL
jgi:hypothetical protein